MVVIRRFIVFMALCASVRISDAFNENSLGYLVNKCAGHLSDGRSSGVKFKLPWSLVASAGWSLVRKRLYSVHIPSMKKRS